MIDISKLSNKYTVRRMSDSDAEDILEFCKGNPQSTHFWKKNGFSVIYEADRDGHALLVAEKEL